MLPRQTTHHPTSTSTSTGRMPSFPSDFDPVLRTMTAIYPSIPPPVLYSSHTRERRFRARCRNGLHRHLATRPSRLPQAIPLDRLPSFLTVPLRRRPPPQLPSMPSCPSASGAFLLFAVPSPPAGVRHFACVHIHTASTPPHPACLPVLSSLLCIRISSRSATSSVRPLRTSTPSPRPHLRPAVAARRM
ncbi:hypothetical protein B0H12DRAFT_442553 [Mycena haematopus]|nr:hypothetical protein B0H12DRAFT_442553 [Mycena haematopus]